MHTFHGDVWIASAVLPLGTRHISSSRIRLVEGWVTYAMCVLVHTWLSFPSRKEETTFKKQEALSIVSPRHIRPFQVSKRKRKQLPLGQDE